MLVAVAIVTLMLGFLTAWFWLVTAVCVLGIVPTYRTESREDDVASERYERTRMCTRCGKFYLVAKQA